MTFQLLKVGSDAEFFLRDKKTGNPVPVIGLFGGTKRNPKPVLDEPGFCIQEDNVMPEVNIPAASDAESFARSTEKILAWLRHEAAEKGLKVEVVPSMKFTKEQLKHPQAQEIGCEPDFCVWTRSENMFDESKRKILDSLRTAGGHVHISYTNTRKKLKETDHELLVMFCDLFMGVPSVILDKDLDRKQLYGKGGSFRFKPYGIEYRVLSNFWFKSVEYAYWIFSQAFNAVAAMNDKGKIRFLLDESRAIQDVINSHDENKAISIIETWGIQLP